VSGVSGSWEERVREELRRLRDLWSKYRARHITPAIREVRARGNSEDLDVAARLEEYDYMVRSLFIEVEEELEAEVRARQRGDEFNAVIAAQRAAEALEMLRIYAKSWREELQGVGGSG
jgi:hypothetical protein